MSFNISQIGSDSPLFDQVFGLHKASKATLGPLPIGAFQELAQRGQLFGAIAPDGALAGYLLYRVARNRAAITHLTSGEAFRGSGVAKLLIDQLKRDSER